MELDGRIKARTLRSGWVVASADYLSDFDTLRRSTAMCGLLGKLVD
jgi:hypothetical protein